MVHCLEYSSFLQPARAYQYHDSGLVQLITAGMGAPFLGDYQGVDDVSEGWM